MPLKKIIFTVTNDLTYDQRMQRICGTLAQHGYEILLIGRKLPTSKPLQDKPYRQKRLYCFFKKGILFYAFYNIQLLLYLLIQKNFSAICSIDLDTLLPGFLAATIRKKIIIYDAHELFTELTEVKENKFSSKVWLGIEKKILPKTPNGYTVCESIADYFKEKYGVHYATIRNVPLHKKLTASVEPNKTLIYTGAVNEGRSFETLIPAMQYINALLIVCGDGNFMQQAKALTEKYNVSDKILFKGMLLPAELSREVQKAYIGINLVANTGLNQYYSLPNKFFDYIQAGKPQVAMAYPEYVRHNNLYKVAVLLDDISPEKIAEAVNNLLADDVLYKNLQEQCMAAREVLIWENEEKLLLDFYKKILGE